VEEKTVCEKKSDCNPIKLKPRESYPYRTPWAFSGARLIRYPLKGLDKSFIPQVKAFVKEKVVGGVIPRLWVF
jgi:hypothetical protein